MRIAVNARFLLTDYLEGIGYFISETFKYLAVAYPGHEFIFIFDRPFNKRFIFSSNVTAVVLRPPARHPTLWKIWYDLQLPRILKKYKADVFVSADGFCSLTTKLPQCLVVHDLAFLHYPAHSKRSHFRFMKKNLPKYIRKATTIATVSEFSKKDIMYHYQIDPGKISVVYNGIKEIFQPVDSETADEIKSKYTQGTEFFLYVGSIHPRKNLVTLLKAFSIFKKRQKSNIKLVLAGRLAWKYEQFLEDLASYKYRQDVLLLGYLEEKELAKLMASSYALVYPSLFEGFGVPVVEAMRSGVPVITSAGSAMEEITRDGALYADVKSFEDLAEKMMLIYKDENLRARLIEKGKIVSGEYTWPRSAELLWQMILKAVG